MKRRKRLFGFLPILLCVLATQVGAQSELKLGANVSAEFGTLASVPLTLSTDSEVQGLVAAFEWDEANGTGETLTLGEAVADADTIVTRVESNFVVIGVVMDSDGVDNEVILPGSGLAVATVGIRCGGAAASTDINFVDGVYATVAGGPTLDNIVVIGGLSISQTDGLTLTNGGFRCTPAPSKLFVNDNGGSGDDGCGSASVLMRNLDPVEGYVVALCHDASVLTLQSIDVGAAASGAEFSATDLLSNGGTLGVVLDFSAPFDGQTIPTGDSQEIAVYNYCCNNPPGAAESAVVTPLSFCEMELGEPAKQNVLVVGGLSFGVAEGLGLEDGSFQCNPVGEIEVPPEDCNNGIDDDGDGFADEDDQDCQQGFLCEDTSGSLGGQSRVDLFVKAFPDQIQGLSMAIEHCCEITAVEELDISDTILEAVGAEFVSVQGDSNPNDGDGCETIVGVLVDALPPFDGVTIPPLPDFQRVGTLTFNITDDSSACNKVCELNFKDGLNGSGKVPVKNLISVDNQSKSVAVFSCEIRLVGPERFHRGDCNFSNMGSMSVDISDAAAVVSFLFLMGDWKFNPPCLDACDCNDDGRIDLADAICVLQFYLQSGTFPPAPGPGLEMVSDGGIRETSRGVDPTADKLGCAGGTDCD